MKFLVTGFVPFAGDDYNPTQPAVEALASVWQHPAELVTEILPVEFLATQERLRALINEHQPDVLLSCGLNEGLTHPVLEHTAHNLMNARTPDNAGYAPQNLPVVAQGPESLQSNLPIKAMIAAADAHGYTVEHSDDAGRYVCNMSLYIGVTEQVKRGALSGFLHIPADPGRQRAREDAAMIAAMLGACVGE